MECKITHTNEVTCELIGGDTFAALATAEPSKLKWWHNGHWYPPSPAPEPSIMVMISFAILLIYLFKRRPI